MSEYMFSISDFAGRRTLGAVKLDLGKIALFFSFDHMVAYQIEDQPPVVTTFPLGPHHASTNRHLDVIDGGSDEAVERRLTPELFSRRLAMLSIDVTVHYPQVAKFVDREVQNGQ